VERVAAQVGVGRPSGPDGTDEVELPGGVLWERVVEDEQAARTAFCACDGNYLPQITRLQIPPNK
jgi:hypothetical protein